MPYTGGYQPGFTLEYDRNGNLVDKSATIIERYIQLGEVWRIGLTRKALTAGEMAFLTFKTPALGVTFYSFATLSKTGDEVQYTLNEGGVVENGTAVAAWNLNRIRGDAGCPFTATKAGSSLDATPMTLTGGLDAPYQLLSGAAGGNDRPGGCSSGATGLILKADTVYTLVLYSIGSASVNATLDVAQVGE